MCRAIVLRRVVRVPPRASKFQKEVTSGDHGRALEAMREKLAAECERAVDGKELAALMLRLQSVLNQIAELGGAIPDEDDLAERRRAKLSA